MSLESLRLDHELQCLDAMRGQEFVWGCLTPQCVSQVYLRAHLSTYNPSNHLSTTTHHLSIIILVTTHTTHAFHPTDG